MNSAVGVALLGALLWCSLVQRTWALPTTDPVKEAKVYDFLNKYGYFDHVLSKSEGDLPTETEKNEAIRSMQRYGGLPPTGLIDEATAGLVTKPRCGVKDGEPSEVVRAATPPGRRRSRQRRYSILGDPYKWTDKTDLTYKVVNYPGDNSPDMSRQQVDRDIAAAFRVWSGVTPLTFTEVRTDAADIRFVFGRRLHTRVQGDPPFDGPGGVLAHAFTPNSGWGETNGDVHLDDDESFTHGVFSGTNLFYTLAHEIGHALGLFHSDHAGSLMFAYDRGYLPNFRLSNDDRKGIQALYGPNLDNVPRTEAPVAVVPTEAQTAVSPPHCLTTFDVVAFIDKEYLMFGDRKLWRFDVDLNLLSEPEGQSPRDIFPKFPTVGVRAVYQVGGMGGRVIVLKAKNYWAYERAPSSSASSPPLFRLESGNFPRPVKELGFPKSVSGVVHIPDVDLSYLLKGKKVFVFDEALGRLASSSSPVKTVFDGVQGRPTAGFFDEDLAYVLVGQDVYSFVYSYDVSAFIPIKGDPLNFAQHFLQCPSE